MHTCTETVGNRHVGDVLNKVLIKTTVEVDVELHTHVQIHYSDFGYGETYSKL